MTETNEDFYKSDFFKNLDKELKEIRARKYPNEKYSFDELEIIRKGLDLWHFRSADIQSVINCTIKKINEDKEVL